MSDVEGLLKRVEELNQGLRQWVNLSPEHEYTNECAVSRLLKNDVCDAIPAQRFMRQMAAVIDELVAHIRGDGWRPISEAPRDYTQVLCRKKDRRCNENGGYLYDVWAGIALHEKRARLDEGVFKQAPHLAYLPEEWQPLPSPPADNKEPKDV